MRWAVLFVATVAVSGCAGARQAQEARLNSKDDAQCSSYGAKPGSDAYIACRTQLSTARTNASAIRDSSSVICNKVGTAVICD